MTKRTLIGAAVVGFLGAASALPIMWAATRNERLVQGFASVSAGEWVQAASGIVGVALTVAATLWLEERKRRQAQAEEETLLRDAVSSLQREIVSITTDIPKIYPEHADIDVDKFYEDFLGRIKAVNFAKSNTKIRKVELWQALEEIGQAFTLHRPSLEREMALASDPKSSPKVLLIAFDKLKTFAETIEKAAVVATVSLGVPVIVKKQQRDAWNIPE